MTNRKARGRLGALAATAAGVLGAGTAQSQTSGRIGLELDANWNAAPLIITAGPGSAPDATGHGARCLAPEDAPNHDHNPRNSP